MEYFDCISSNEGQVGGSAALKSYKASMVITVSGKVGIFSPLSVLGDTFAGDCWYCWVNKTWLSIPKTNTMHSRNSCWARFRSNRPQYAVPSTTHSHIDQLLWPNLPLQIQACQVQTLNGTVCDQNICGYRADGCHFCHLHRQQIKDRLAVMFPK